MDVADDARGFGTEDVGGIRRFYPQITQITQIFGLHWNLRNLRNLRTKNLSRISADSRSLSKDSFGIINLLMLFGSLLTA